MNVLNTAVIQREFMDTTLTELEQEVIEIFVRMAGMLSLPRSVGELYGLLYISPGALCIDDCVTKLQISKGSTSQGLKILRSFGAVKTVYVPGSRRDHFVAESALRKIVTGFLDEQIRPQLEGGKERLVHLEKLASAEENSEYRDFLTHRIGHLKNWQKKAGTVLPFALNFMKSDA